ncbi:MAG: GntR family transcriptional regulator [Nitrospirae bacterium]|nr:GntR family transcriptional regulator [Nitrospirota bacterium]
MQAHLEIGKFNDLTVKKETAIGVYLDSDAGDILLPRKYVPGGAGVGDVVNVFVYCDSEDRLVATTLKPAALVGECAWLKVVALSRAGAFLDWGIQKDLLVPYSEQSVKMEVGNKYIVRIFLDERTQRIAATTKIGRFMEKENTGLREGESASLLIYRFTDYGIKVIINNRCFGLLYENEVFEKLHVGDKVEGHIRRIRPDGKIDVVLGKTGTEGIEDAKVAIMRALKEHRGFLPMGDFSAPEHIREMLHMSKKTFKKAVGGLYKNELIEIKEDGIKLKKVDKAKMVQNFKF